MGGKLFKLGRIPSKEYLAIETNLRQYLDIKLDDYYRIPRYYQNKPDFGDMDIIVSNAAFSGNWSSFRQEIVEDLGVTQFKSDGRVFSTVYQNFQVDYFIADRLFFESTYNYLSFNDLGNLLGKICRRFNLKYGEKGIAYVFRHRDGNYKKDLSITTDFIKICNFLQLDYQQWQRGFEKIEDIFAWVIASPYFSVTPYLERANSLERRAKERTTINKFLEYIEKYQISKSYDYLEDRDRYIPLVDQFFPEANLLEKIALEKEAEAKAIQIKAKFNGQLLMQLIPNLKGKELGQFIVEFKQQFDNFEDYILVTPQAEINQRIIDAYED